MFNAMCRIPSCRKPAVTIRQYSWFWAIDGPNSSPWM